jgi:hypothetical protein
LTGSTSTVAGLRDYVETLRRIAANTAVSLTDKDKVDVEQSTFVLEGLRDGLMTAEFRDRAEKVNDTIRALNRLVEAYNAAGGA